MYTAPTRVCFFNLFLSTLHSHDIRMAFLLFPMLVFALFWDRFLDACWIVFGFIFGALRDQKVSKYNQKTMWKFASGKSDLGFRGGTTGRAPGTPPPDTPPWDPDGRKDKVPHFGFWFWFLDLGQKPKIGLPYIPKIKNGKDPSLIIGLLALAKN